MIRVNEYRTKIDKIHNDTIMDSFFSRMIKHPDFQYLLSIGKEIIPYIINDLRINPNWVHLNLLRLLVIDDYISSRINTEEIQGRFQKYVELWLKWWDVDQRENKLKRITKDT